MSELGRLADNFLDITGTGVTHVGVQIDKNATGHILRVNVDGICVLRVCRARYIELEDCDAPSRR